MPRIWLVREVFKALLLNYCIFSQQPNRAWKWNEREREREKERNWRDLRVVGFGRIERSHGSFSQWIRADCCADKLGGMVWGLVVHGWDFAKFHKALLYIETTTLEWTFQILYFYQKSCPFEMIILLIRLILLLFISFIVIFFSIYGFLYTILTNFYLYL